MAASMKKLHPRKRLAYTLRAAVIDAKRIDDGHVPNFKLEMYTYADEIEGEYFVCLAGAHMVLGKSLPARGSTEWGHWTTAQWKVARNLNDMRTGLLPSGIRSNDAVANRAMALIRRHYNDYLQRAPWPIYMEAAAILAGEM